MELQPNEKIIKIVYRPLFVYSLNILASLILILGACFFMVPLFRLILWGQTWIGKAIFWFLIALGLIFGLRTLSEIIGNKIIITNQRVILIMRQGFLNQIIFKLNFEKIRTVSLSVKGLFATILGLGTLEFTLAESQEILKFSNISRADQIQELILHLQSSSKKNNIEQMNNYELVEIARKIRDKLGRDVFRRISEE